jgi:hypothetical protein
VNRAARGARGFGLHADIEAPAPPAGSSSPLIADRLYVSPRTVGVHVSRMLTKRAAPNRFMAAEMARSRGLLEDATSEISPSR